MDSNHFVWAFRKDQPPFEANIVNVGVEKSFYSTENSIIDEKITEAECNFAELLNTLRTKNENDSINAALLPKFIAHLEIRTRHLRESLTETSDMFLKEIIRFFQRPENTSKFIASNMDEIFSRVYGKVSSFKSWDCSKSSFYRNMNKTLQTEVEKMFFLFVNNSLPGLFKEMPDIVKKAHLDTIKKSLSPEKKERAYQKLKWKLIFTSFPNYILGDFGVLFEVASSKRFTTFWDKGDKLINVFLPISKNHLIIGSSTEEASISNFNWFNEEIAKHSREYFLSAVNSPIHLNYSNHIGANSHFYSEQEMMSFCNDLFQNNLKT